MIEVVNQPSQPLFVIGLTGHIGAGKSTLAKAFRAIGATVIDADIIVGILLQEHAPAIANLIDQDIIVEGKLDKRRLAQIVFDDTDKRHLLEQFLHPRVEKVFLDMCDFWKKMGQRLVVYDAPLLFEAGHERLTQWTVVVVADKDIRRRRAVARGMTADQFDRRDAAHLPNKEKLADVIVRNQGDTVQELQTAAIEIMRIAVKSIKEAEHEHAGNNEATPQGNLQPNIC